MSEELRGRSAAVETAREYYNSDDADNFYHRIWGGEDIHVGLYESETDSILAASRRTVARMADAVDGLGAASRVLDLGAGYGGAARYLARRFGCRVVALNLSEVENARNRAMTAEQGLTDRVEVVEGSFERIPYPDASFDLVWSQDAILHSDDRATVVSEVARVLKPGGEWVFTDPMQADDCPPGVLQPILDRIHLGSLGSPAFYRAAAAEHGLVEAGFEALTHHLTRHYARVLRETERREQDLRGHVSGAYIARMNKGLHHWIAGGRDGHLAWGIFRFRKPR